jgi:DhnA family fructose-bisphosphate aldolase class Ia
MNAIVATNAHLMVLCFGMNDNASAMLYTNMLSIINRARTAGMEVIVMPVPRTPTTEDGRYSLKDWRYMNRMAYNAARDGGAAYVPTNWLTEDNGRGGMGLALTSLCGSDLRNHPGGVEMGVYGKALINLFI